jgi:hypothetical protein
MIRFRVLFSGVEGSGKDVWVNSVTMTPVM